MVFKCACYFGEGIYLQNAKAVDIDKSRDDLRDAELCANLSESLDMIISCYNSTLRRVA